MAIKIGQASADENRKASGGAAGDQTGGEVHIRTWYSSPWDTVLRPKTAELAEKSAAACEAACANSKIGYDQGSRNTLYLYAKLVDFDLAKITDKCECDCSSLMHVCAIAGGANLPYGYNGFWTGNMVDGIMASGQYEKLTEPKYLTSDAFLKRGDILVNTTSHTAMALENGAGERESEEMVQVTATGNETKVTVFLPMLRKGSKGASVYALQLLLTAKGYDTMGADSDFGRNTESALMDYQIDKGLEVDGICGKESWTSLLTT